MCEIHVAMIEEVHLARRSSAIPVPPHVKNSVIVTQNNKIRPWCMRGPWKGLGKEIPGSPAARWPGNHPVASAKPRRKAPRAQRKLFSRFLNLRHRVAPSILNTLNLATRRGTRKSTFRHYDTSQGYPSEMSLHIPLHKSFAGGQEWGCAPTRRFTDHSLRRCSHE